MHNWHSRKSNQSITIRSANVVSFIRLSGLFITMYNSEKEYLGCFRSFAWCLKKLVCIMKKRNSFQMNVRCHCQCQCRCYICVFYMWDEFMIFFFDCFRLYASVCSLTCPSNIINTYTVFLIRRVFVFWIVV